MSKRVKVDFTVPKTLKVTKQDIARGKRYSASWCPIACALRRTFGKQLQSVKVTDDCLTVKLQGLSLGLHLKGAEDFIYAFDMWGKTEVKPKQFPFKICGVELA